MIDRNARRAGDSGETEEMHGKFVRDVRHNG